MNFGHLAVFHAVAEAGSVSRAAERLLVSQPAVSKQLGLLERELKTVLVDRLPRGVRLTAAGEVLAGYARRIFAVAEEAERAMGELAGVSRGKLVVAATPTIGTYWLPGVLVGYRREYPGVEMRMEVHPTGTIVRLLREGAVDVGLVEWPVEDDGVEAREFMKDRLVAIAGKGHALGGKRRGGWRRSGCGTWWWSGRYSGARRGGGGILRRLRRLRNLYGSGRTREDVFAHACWVRSRDFPLRIPGAGGKKDGGWCNDTAARGNNCGGRSFVE